MDDVPLPVSRDSIAAFCHRWKVWELALFGSVLRPDFSDSSDVDVLVTFAADAGWSALDLVEAAADLAQVLGRPVDLVERSALRNPFRRHAILTSARVVYAA